MNNYICSTHSLESAPESFFYILLIVYFPEHEISNDTNEPKSSKVDGIIKLKALHPKVK